MKVDLLRICHEHRDIPPKGSVVTGYTVGMLKGVLIVA